MYCKFLVFAVLVFLISCHGENDNSPSQETVITKTDNENVVDTTNNDFSDLDTIQIELVEKSDTLKRSD